MANREPVTFTIVEQSDDFDYDGFEKDYMAMELSKAEMMEKYHLSNSQYGTRVRRVKRETGFVRPKSSLPKKKDRYIHHNDSGTYTVKKLINNIYSSQITVPDYDTAVKIRDLLIEHDWDKDYIMELRKECSVPRGFSAKGLVYCPVKTNALKHYDKFRDLYFDMSYKVDDIQKELNISRHQYNCLKEELMNEFPDLPNRNELRRCKA